jgi:hypothetical protein
VEKNTFKLNSAPAAILNLKYWMRKFKLFFIGIHNKCFDVRTSQTIASPSWDTSVLEKLHAGGLICIVNENKTRTRICIYFYATDRIQYTTAEYVTAWIQCSTIQHKYKILHFPSNLQSPSLKFSPVTPTEKIEANRFSLAKGSALH